MTLIKRTIATLSIPLQSHNSRHVACGASKKEWERIKRIEVGNGYFFFRTIRGQPTTYRNTKKHPLAPGRKLARHETDKAD